MTKKKCGATPKFPNVETTVLRINRVVPEKLHDELRKKTNEFIDNFLINRLQSEALDKCSNEALKSKL